MFKNYSLESDIPDDVLNAYLAQKEVAIDTELQGLRLFRDQVCLIQICDRNQQVCLVRPDVNNPPPNLIKLLTSPGTIKVFHYALADVAFLKTSLGIEVSPYRCTKVMSKLSRTYTEGHGLKNLVAEMVGVELDKTSQTTNWGKADLSPDQLRYAANDVIHLLEIYDALKALLEERGMLPGGVTAVQLNEQCQAALAAIVNLVIAGYGDSDGGWKTSVFSH